ncbi:MAG TPA: aldose 1-epimerase family protein [Bacillota bacterium]|nr:aldose 1-epimerase family protein [Bacillota bacterium]
MAQFAGKNFTRKELSERVGSISQIDEVTRFAYQEGRAKGLEGISFRTGSGLDFVVLPGRGMDLGIASFRGLPLCWLSPAAYSGPEYFEPQGDGWLRSFAGGLLTTCGLTYLGDPCQDEGEELGLHGRIANTPAQHVCTWTRWEGDDYYLHASGQVREASAFGPNVVMTRTITAKLGEAKIFLRDEVENQGFEKVPHMILYHINLGYPLVCEDSELKLPPHTTIPKDPVAEANPDYASFAAPTYGYQPRVYYHMLKNTEEKATITLTGSGLKLDLTYHPGQLPNLVHWKRFEQGSYVLGLEPANCRVDGRAEERARGTLSYLKPGEKRCYELEFAVSAI